MAHRPRATPEQIASLAQERYGLTVRAIPLAGERDLNFRLDDLQGGSPRGVLKVSNGLEDRRTLELQDAVLRHLADAGLSFAIPEPLAGGPAGPDEVEFPGEGGEHLRRTHFVRVLSWVPGMSWATFQPHDRQLLRSLGTAVAECTKALEGFTHPGLRRKLIWDLGAAGWIRDALPELPEQDRLLLAPFVDRYDRRVVPRLPDLGRSAIHNDWNDHNTLVRWDPAEGPPAGRVAGLIDFGDLLEGAPVIDLGVAIAYAILGQTNPLAAAAHVVEGYVTRRPLSETEADVLYDLVGARYVLSAIVAQRQAAAAPDNVGYLETSQAPLRAVLWSLNAVHPRFARYSLRAAAGLEPDPSSPKVRAFLATRGRAAVAPLASLIAPCPAAIRVLDLSVGSPDLGSGEIEDPAALDRAIREDLDQAETTVGIGRWDEPRLLYRASGFDSGDGTEEGGVGERRTVHIGLDIFVPAGTEILAPIEGTVASVADNARPLDYGPTLMLAHRTDDDMPFWTLYGHLDPDVLTRWAPGDPVSPGATIARVGAMDRNGGWSPHLHFQIVTDLLGREGDYPGVAAARERAVWRSLSPDPGALLGLEGAAHNWTDAAEVREQRSRVAGRNLSLSYRDPLLVLRGMGTRLYTADGREYLDCVNNVAHVGHAHPAVVEAEVRQSRILNTNTRYLHPVFGEYAARLLMHFPEPLEVVFFVNSGSEANELALRLARTATGRRDVVVLDGAYHGNTGTLIDLSPYKHDGPGGEGPPAWVHVALTPDPYRGRFRDEQGAGPGYVESVRAQFREAAERGRHAGAFLAEPLLSCAGQIDPPAGFLAGAYGAAREAGAICIADEVQVGLGRVGTDWWGFQAHGACPDVVTLGKPLGNGHPLGAVVTTREIADRFANGMEYFNTFGGNPVSCAVGLAVLDVLHEEGLRENAHTVGAYLRDGLLDLSTHHPLIGDVRGRGLFLGVELVLDPVRRTPAPLQTRWVVDRLKSLGVLVSSDGPDHNVLKLKPPLVFRQADAAALLRALDRILGETPSQPSELT